MPKKKQSKFTKALVWIVKNFFKSVWFVIKSIFRGIAHLFKKSSSAIKESNKKRITKKQQPKVEASYQKLNSSSIVKGALKTFENRLLNESLIVAIAGRRGSGKSVLGFRFLENAVAKAKRPAFALGVRQSVLPAWIQSIEDITEVKHGGVVLVDEGAVSFSSRSSMSKKNKGLAELLAVARHKDLTLLFITQNTGMIDKNVLNLCDTIVLKEGSLLQEKMERSVMKDLYATANSALKNIPSSERKSHCYVFDADFEGMIKTDLPSFWSSKVSKNQA